MGVLKALSKILLLTLVLMSVLWLWFSTTMVIGRLSRKRFDFRAKSHQQKKHIGENRMANSGNHTLQPDRRPSNKSLRLPPPPVLLRPIQELVQRRRSC